MEDIKNTCVDGVKGFLDIKEGRGFKATLAGIAIGFIAKRFTQDNAASLGAGLVAYSIVKRV